MPGSTIGERLLALKQRSGLSLNEIAKAAGYRGPSSVQAYFSADYDAPSISRPLAIRLTKALVGHGSPAITSGDVTELYRPFHSMQIERISPSTEDLQTGIPVYAALAEIWRPKTVPDYLRGTYPFEVSFGRPAAYRPWPRGLPPEVKAYATFMRAQAMHPRYYTNEMIVAEEGRPPNSGESALIFLQRSIKYPEQNQSGNECYALEFIERDDDALLFKAVKDNRNFIIPLDDILRLDRIVPYQELLGLVERFGS